MSEACEGQVIVPVLARTPEGAKRLLSMVEARGAAAAELVGPLKRCAHWLSGALQACECAAHLAQGVT